MAEADAEYGFFRFQCLIYQPRGRIQKGIAVALVDAHRSAQHDQTDGIAHIARDLLAGEGAHIGGFEAIALEDLAGDAEIFWPSILQHP